MSALLALLLSPAAPAQDAGTAILEVQPDPRLCPGPMCGGWWVRLVNQARTPCADGVDRAWCYVTAIDFSPLQLPPDELAALQQAASERRALIQATPIAFDLYGTRYARLEASRAWVDVN